MTITRLLARPMLASIFVVGGVNALRNTEGHAAKAKPVADRVVPLAQKAAPGIPIPTDTATLVRINAGAQLLASALLWAPGRLSLDPAGASPAADLWRRLGLDDPLGAVAVMDGPRLVALRPDPSA